MSIVEIESGKRQRLSLKSNCCSQKVLVAEEGRTCLCGARGTEFGRRAERRKQKKKTSGLYDPSNPCTTPFFLLGAFPSQLFSVFFQSCSTLVLRFVSFLRFANSAATKLPSMSSMRNAVQRRQHRERGQLEGREKWGLLEKHKVSILALLF